MIKKPQKSFCKAPTTKFNLANNSEGVHFLPLLRNAFETTFLAMQVLCAGATSQQEIVPIK